VQANTNFSSSLAGYVKNFDLDESKVSKVNFASGTGGVVNVGSWSDDAHANDSRVTIFKKVMQTLKDANAATCNNDD